MSLELHDVASLEENLSSGNTRELEVDSATAEYIEVIIDDGAGNAPSSYDLTVEFYSTAVDSYMQVDSVSAVTDRTPAIRSDARCSKVRVTLTAGAADDYRVSVETHSVI